MGHFWKATVGHFPQAPKETAKAQPGGTKKAETQKATAKRTANKASAKAAKKTTASGQVAGSESVAQ
jgi:hypothetical protein